MSKNILAICLEPDADVQIGQWTAVLSFLVTI